MATPAIVLEDVGKRYVLGEHHGTRSDLRDTIVATTRRLRGQRPPVRRELWSLRHVTLTVDEGEALGIIGANGAGKSTLLKVVSNITTPTEGCCRTRGRVGSLLEVGTGFHGELTGLENTYLNGAILGMSRREVTRRLGEIIEFAGLGDFMDTPVKRYSSGMYLRLGFAIAAHLDADILVVDEVLAVGDADFQRRCLGKMGEVEQSGRTVLFVSHNMDAIARLCRKVVWLDRGAVTASGPAEKVITRYLSSSTAPGAKATIADDPTLPAQVTGVSAVDEHGVPQSTFPSRSPLWIELDVLVRSPVIGLDASAMVFTRHGSCVLNESLSDTDQAHTFEAGHHRLRCPVPPILAPGEYVVGMWLGTQYDEFQHNGSVLTFSVDGDDGNRTPRLLRLEEPWDVLSGAPPSSPSTRELE